MDTCAYCDAKPLYRDRESGDYLCPVHAWLEVIGPRGETPQTPLTIRPATPADRPRIAELADYWGETEIERFDHSYQVDALPAYVACGGEETIGMACYAREGDAVNLVVLNVLPQWQGRGAARGLIAAVIQEARTADAKRIIVATTNDDLPALGLYQRLGFTITDVLVGKLAERHGDVKPGFDNIPIRDEIQLELQL
jgi:N-acetylglutamate synthase-like GNAT family acetyltransferase